MLQSLSNQKLVIFDCDGVLVDSEQLSNRALIDCLAELEIQLTVDEAVTRFRGRNLADCFSEIEASANFRLPESFERTFRQRRSEYFEAHLQPIAGIQEAIERIPYAKCVASNGPPQMIERNLAITGLSHHFGTRIFSAYEIQKWKPEPHLFLHACKELEFKPNDCIVVEDSESGAEAARSGGFAVLTFGFQPSVKFRGSSFYDMSELPELINSFFGEAKQMLDAETSFAVIFSSHISVVSAEYEETAQKMLELVSTQPGFLRMESARGENGFGITISYSR